jgi:hypothetical protein
MAFQPMPLSRKRAPFELHLCDEESYDRILADELTTQFDKPQLYELVWSDRWIETQLSHAEPDPAGTPDP